MPNDGETTVSSHPEAKPILKQLSVVQDGWPLQLFEKSPLTKFILVEIAVPLNHIFNTAHEAARPDPVVIR